MRSFSQPCCVHFLLRVRKGLTGRNACVLQAWLVPHSQVDADSKTRNPMAPRVHSGFFASWHRNELDQRVLDHVRGLVNSRKTASLADLRVIVTGRHPTCELPVSSFAVVWCPTATPAPRPDVASATDPDEAQTARACRS